MFKIGEFSKLVRVSPRMLRYYEKCGLLYPAVIDKFTGYRQYSAAQIPLLTKIVTLRDMGFSIDEIGDVLPHFDDATYMSKIFIEKSMAVKAVIETENKRLQKINAAQNDLLKELTSMKYEITLKELPPVNVLSYRATIAKYSDEGSMWEKLMGYIAENRIACSSGEDGGCSVYHDDDYKESDVDIEIAVPMDMPGTSNSEFAYKTLDAIPLAATLRFSGSYDGYTKAMEKLAQWIEQNGYELCGLTRGVMLRTEADQNDPQNFLTEIQIPVKKTEG